MENQTNICQSCGMPLHADPSQGGTNTDGSKSDKYCGFCFQEGKFTDEGISLAEKIDKNVRIAVMKTGISENEARTMAESVLPNLKRWKS